MLNVTDVNVSYGMHKALSSVSLQVKQDEIVVILGANGAGKSTLLSAIAGNCAGAVQGNILFNGEPVLGMDAAQVVAEGIAYVPEGRGVFSDLSVEENLQLGSFTEHARHSENENLRRVLSLFPRLEERKKQTVRTMSGGEQQMVAIGRALMSAPSLLMLDEPSLGLSPLLCKELFSSLKQVRDSGVGILLVEQNARQSLSISDRGYLLGNGEIIGHDNAQSLLNDPTVQAAYLGGAMATQTAPATVSKSVTAAADKIPATVKQLSGGITPDSASKPAETVSANSLVNEDINALVARAGTAASQHRNQPARAPVNIVKLSRGKKSAEANNRTVRNTHTSATNDSSPALDTLTAHADLPPTQDKKIQALLADMEQAARSAESSSRNRKKVVTPADNHHDHDEKLPHIPVYKKSTVTVYRRDSAGDLRKQDKT